MSALDPGATVPALDHGLRLFVDTESYLDVRQRLDAPIERGTGALGTRVEAEARL